MGHHAIEDLAVLFVFVEPVVQISPQKPSALRHSEPDRASNRPGGNAYSITAERRSIFQVRDRIANCRSANAGYRRILRPVNDFVNLRWLESAGQIHASAIELPLTFWNEAARPFDRIAHAQRVGR